MHERIEPVSREMLGPTFFIIGAAKAATTSLSSLLASHPQVGIARGKEPHFFSIDEAYGSGWDVYLKSFAHCDGRIAIGDASTSYSRIRHHPAAPDRIRRHVPSAKIIYMVRHPLERMESAYVEHLCNPHGPVFESINDAVRRQPMIVDSSRYWEVFHAYRERFGEHLVKIVWFEEYVTETAKVFQDVCRFLEVDDGLVPDFARERRLSRADAHERMVSIGRGDLAINNVWEPETRTWVLEQLSDDNRIFLSHFGRSSDYWSKEPR